MSSLEDYDALDGSIAYLDQIHTMEGKGDGGGRLIVGGFEVDAT